MIRGRILKWALRAPGVTTVDCPVGSTVLSVAYQEGELRVWVAFPHGPRVVRRTFHVVETGAYVPEAAALGELVGSARDEAGSVLHVFYTAERLP